MNNLSNYSALSKFLHYLALENHFLAQTSFELEQAINKTIYGNKGQLEKPVFISGLARSGSTIITRLLYDSDEFCSLTYRNMPFLLMPNLWPKISKFNNKESVEKERAHNDGIKVDYDSPEEFDETFWRVYSGSDYIKKEYLMNYEPDNDLLDLYKKYLIGIIASKQKSRYISKNNNNILRLNSLYKVFPDAIVFIPFRDPLQHSFSLLKQHKHFCGKSNKDSFVTQYMNWLGHFEFGPNHKYFKLPNSINMPKDKNHIDYWLTQWINVYNYLLNNSPSKCIFVCYEHFCQSPKTELDNIFTIAGIRNKSNNAYKKIKISKSTTGICNSELEKISYKIYNELVTNINEGTK